MNETEAGRVKIIDEISVEIKEEDHTLMNVLKWAISNNWCSQKVEFCGYNVPHPSDELVHLSVQFEDEAVQSPENVMHAIAEGLDSVEACCSNILRQIDNF